MPNSQGAPEPSAMSLNRLEECQACANVSAVRSSAARVRTRLALEPRPHPCGVAVVELAEGEGILARRGEQVGIGSDLVVRSGSKRFAT